jgi:glycolate oxidase FAD binding subunit
VEATCTIDDLGPLPVERPGSARELGERVRRAREAGEALYPCGGQTMFELGLPPTKRGVVLDLGQLHGVIDYPAQDMTITVQTGVRLATLQEILAPENQRLPIDVPCPEQATLGGALACNVSGPRRLGFGTLRDYVIGLHWVEDEGHEVKAGGRVVKNVAGYDLCKLHIGALGTLGILTQVTLKLRPLPETRALVILGCATGSLGPLLDALHQTRTRPCCVEVLNRSAAGNVAEHTGLSLPDAPWVIVVGYEDNEVAVRWQVGQLIGEVSQQSIQGLEALAGDTTHALWNALVALTLSPLGDGFPRPPQQALSFKANLLPGAVASFCETVLASTPEVLVQAQASSGIVRGHLVGDLTLASTQAMLEGWHTEVSRAQGNLVLPRCPVAWKRQLPVWGQPRGDLGLMRSIKEKLDPRGLFNPGRFLAGI